MTHSVNDTLLCNTSHLSIIKITGDDAQAFLQGQFSNDVAQINDQESQLNSYNSPKGRMYAAFRLCNIDSSYLMIIPKEIVGPVLKRLKMFVMRSNVVLEDISDQWKTLGISGENLPELLDSQNMTLPEGIGQCNKYGDKYLINLSSDMPRALILGIESEVVDLRIALEKNYQTAPSSHWLRLDIQAGIPNIYENTMEAFVAQMINFQLIDGVSFTKGCYPGQEVVARMHYLGKLKKRMYRISLEEKASPDDKIYNTDGSNEQSVGQIVDAQENENGGYDALAVIQVAAESSKGLKVGNQNGGSVTIETLPYTFPE